jgi:hypothetical protein
LQFLCLSGKGRKWRGISFLLIYKNSKYGSEDVKRRQTKAKAEKLLKLYLLINCGHVVAVFFLPERKKKMTKMARCFSFF